MRLHVNVHAYSQEKKIVVCLWEEEGERQSGCMYVWSPLAWSVCSLEECIPGKPAAAPVITANSIRGASAAELLCSERCSVFAHSNTAGLTGDLIE